MPAPLRLRSRPLGPSTYLSRNKGKTMPLIAVILLAVMLIAGIVSMINSIPLSIRTIYRYSKNYIGVTPRGDPEQTPRIKARIEEATPVPLDRVIVCRASESVVRSIVGKWPFGVLGLGQVDMQYYLDRMRVSSINGRIPRAGAAEALISEPVARNLNLKLGDNLMGPENLDAYSPKDVKIVGIANSDEWIMLCPIEYHRANHFPPIDLLLVFAKNESDQRILDKWALKEFKGERARIFAYETLEKDTDDMFKILYKILNVIIGTLVMVITLMMSMLMNIYQSQRIQEFGLLQALGYSKAVLLRRVLAESFAVVVGGWIFGLFVAFGLLNVAYRVLMYPQAFALNTLDPAAYAYTIPVPIAILIASGLTVYLRFKKFDPIGVVERRLV